MDKKIEEKGKNLKIQTYEVEWVDVKDIKLDPTNPNVMDKNKLDALRLMMKKKGMLQPCIIDQDGLMADGEHRYKIFLEEGMDKIPCYRLTLTDSERRLIRQTMNKIHGEHNPRDDIDDLLRLSKEHSLDKLSRYLGQEEKQLSDYLESVNQVPESYLSMIIDEKKNTRRTLFISLKLTDDQAKKLLEEMGDSTIKEVILIPIHGMLVDNIGK